MRLRTMWVRSTSKGKVITVADVPAMAPQTKSEASGEAYGRSATSSWNSANCTPEYDAYSSCPVRPPRHSPRQPSSRQSAAVVWRSEGRMGPCITCSRIRSTASGVTTRRPAAPAAAPHRKPSSAMRAAAGRHSSARSFVALPTGPADGGACPPPPRRPLTCPEAPPAPAVAPAAPAAPAAADPNNSEEKRQARLARFGPALIPPPPARHKGPAVPERREVVKTAEAKEGGHGGHKHQDKKAEARKAQVAELCSEADLAARQARWGKFAPSVAKTWLNTPLDVDLLAVKYKEERVDVPATAALRREALHVYGTDGLDAEPFAAHFAAFAPVQLEWINDSSCNVVFTSDAVAENALHMLTVQYVPRRTHAQAGTES